MKDRHVMPHGTEHLLVGLRSHGLIGDAVPAYTNNSMSHHCQIQILVLIDGVPWTALNMLAQLAWHYSEVICRVANAVTPSNMNDNVHSCLEFARNLKKISA